MSGSDHRIAQASINSEEVIELTFTELCTAGQVEPDFVIQLIEYGTIEPEGESEATWRFQNTHVRVIRTAVRLHDDLEVNHPGIAVAIDLMNQIDELRAEVEMLKKYAGKI